MQRPAGGSLGVVVQKCSGACVHAEGWLPTILWAGAEALYSIYRQAALSILAGNNLPIFF